MIGAMIAAKLPTAHQRLQLSVKSLVHPKTILRCYRAQPVRETIAIRVCSAARELGIPEPACVIASTTSR